MNDCVDGTATAGSGKHRDMNVILLVAEENIFRLILLYTKPRL
jgi:hypothetical protein